MKAADKFPLTITEKGVSARIRRASQIKQGRAYDAFVVEYVALGVRRRVWRSDLDDAKEVARDACQRISNGEQASLQLKNGELFSYTRAVEILSPLKSPIDAVAREWADAMAILGGKASVIEACRAWVKSNAVQLTPITVAEAVEQLKNQAEADGKSSVRQKQLAAALDAFAEAFCIDVQAITSDLLSRYLSGLPFKDRTKRNHRDVIGFFNRWLVMRGFLASGTDWLKNVQNYSTRKLSEIEIWSPEEIRRILSVAGDITPFVAAVPHVQDAVRQIGLRSIAACHVAGLGGVANMPQRKIVKNFLINPLKFESLAKDFESVSGIKRSQFVADDDPPPGNKRAADGEASGLKTEPSVERLEPHKSADTYPIEKAAYG